MLKATSGFVILKPIHNKRGILEEKTNKWQVVSILNESYIHNGDTVYFIPHSAMEITAEDGNKYYAVPVEDICALEHNPPQWD